MRKAEMSALKKYVSSVGCSLLKAELALVQPSELNA
jgi:hypothetical protein